MGEAGLIAALPHAGCGIRARLRRAPGGLSLLQKQRAFITRPSRPASDAPSGSDDSGPDTCASPLRYTSLAGRERKPPEATVRQGGARCWRADEPPLKGWFRVSCRGVASERDWLDCREM